METIIKTFDQLSRIELHDIFQLRSEVFVVEQDCAYQDVDGKDPKAIHVFGIKEGRLVAYARCFGPGVYFEEAAIGRVVVPKDQRKYGYGHDILRASVQAIREQFNSEIIKLSAQTYLVHFYNAHKFETIGEEYLEDGIPHIEMICKLSPNN